MKARLIVSTLWIILTACQFNHKQVEVPGSVSAAFQKLHSGVTDVQWIEEQSVFEAKFKDKDQEGSVSFNDKGEVIETEEVISLDQLPNRLAIEEYLKMHHAGQPIGRCEKIVTKDSSIVYEVQITGMELTFDSSGTFTAEEND